MRNLFLIIFFISVPSLACASGCPAGTVATTQSGIIVCNVVGNSVLTASAGGDAEGRDITLQENSSTSGLNYDFIVQNFDRGIGKCIEPNPVTGACSCKGERVRDPLKWIMTDEHLVTVCTAGNPFDRVLKLCYFKCKI